MSADRPEQSDIRSGSVEEAFANGAALLEADPASALRQAHLLLRANRDARAFRLAAAAHRRLDQPAEAQAAELAGIQASFHEPQLEKAAIAQQEGRSAESKALADSFLSSYPDDLLALTLAAEAEIGLRQFEQADNDLRQVLDRAPDYLRASLLLGQSLTMQARLREAIATVDTVLERKPENVHALRQMATLRAEVGDHEEASDCYRRLVAVEGDQAENWTMYAQHLRILGEKSESEDAFRKALELNPNQGAAWWGLAQFLNDSISKADEAAMERIVEDRPDSPTEAAPTHIALSILAERRGNHEEAFEHLARGKALRCKAQAYNPDLLSAEVDEALRNFTHETYERSVGSADESPIFIVGLPRSGSTLVERIVGQHPLVEAAGELQTLSKMVDGLRARAGSEQSYGAYVAGLPAAEVAAIGDMYVTRASDCRHSDKPRFTDKYNLNWLHTGLIRFILPRARILDVRRDALDCCWSNFKMLFADGHANDLRHIGRFYRDYVRTIDAVEQAAPGGILRVRYEELVDDPDATVRRIADFLGIAFDPAMLDFHLSDQPVATPSSEQIRQPINRKGIGSAEPYRQWLGPLIEELGPLADGRS